MLLLRNRCWVKFFEAKNINGELRRLNFLRFYKFSGLFVETVHLSAGGNGVAFINQEIWEVPGKMMRNISCVHLLHGYGQDPEADFRLRDQSNLQIPPLHLIDNPTC